MKHSTLKKLGVSALAICVLALPFKANAQTETIQVDLITQSAITTTNASNMDFGEWFLIYGGAGTGVLTLTDDGSVSATATTTPPGSTFTNLTPSASEGVATVQIPAAAVMTMTRNSTTDFVDAGLSLTAVSYRTATENGNINTDTATAPVTIVAGGIPETVTFGGDISITATPGDATHVATFDVTFSY